MSATQHQYVSQTSARAGMPAQRQAIQGAAASGRAREALAGRGSCAQRDLRSWLAQRACPAHAIAPLS
eukprot:6192413-Pleurochrysis_carterae.AAC.2